VSVFRGKYPPDLQKVVGHARRLAKLLAEMEQARTDAWFFGRVGELRGVVSLAVTDWRSGARDSEAARRDIVSYLDQMHRGASRKLRCGLALACCEFDDAITSVGEDEDGEAWDPSAGGTRVGLTTAGPTAPAAWEDGPEVLARVREGLDWVDKSARALARRLGPRSASVSLDELRAFGRDGLLDAARAFDEGRGVTFEKWASIAIRNAIVDGLRASGAIPAGARRRLLRAGAIDPEGEQGVANGAAKSEIATSFDTSEERLHADRSAGGIAASDGDALGGVALSPEDVLARAQQAALVRELVAKLPKDERAFIERTYFRGQTLEQAAAALGHSRSWATRTHARAIAAMEEEALRQREGKRRPGGGAWRPKRP
jgi:RNA polymerase sigma factor for flagellar operon FliA